MRGVRYIGAGLAVVVLALAGCASAPKGMPDGPDMARVWPLPPETPRVAWLHQIRTPADTGVREGRLKRLFSAFTGRRPVPALEKPTAVYADGDGWLMVGDVGLQVVHLYNMNKHTYAQAFALPEGRLASPVGVAFDPQRGWVFVADSILNRIFIYDTEGYYQGSFGEGLVRPSGLMWDPQGQRLFAADTGNHRVVIFDREGRQSGVIGRRGEKLGEFNFPTHVARDGKGRLYVADSLNFRVQQFSPEGEVLRQVGRLGGIVGTFSKPKGVAVDDDGHLYVVDGIYDVVQMFDGEGNLLMHFGGAGAKPGQFWLPTGVAVAGRDVFVADTHNQRIQVFRKLAASAAPGPVTPEPVVENKQ